MIEKSLNANPNVVTFDETGEKRVVRGWCRICARHESLAEGVISPSGLMHIGHGHGITACGKDATGDGWWWPT